MTEDLYIRFVALLAAALMVPSVVFGAMRATNPEIPYWRFLAWGCLAIFLASTLSALRDVIPTLAATLLSNLLIGVGYFLNLKAARSLEGADKHNATDLALLVLYLTLAMMVNFGASNYETRVVLVSFGICVFTAATAHQILSIRKDLSKLGAWIVVSISFTNIVVSSARGAAAFAGQDTYVFSLSLWDPVFFICSIAVVFGFSIGFFIIGMTILSVQTQQLLDHERSLTLELNTAIDAQKDLQKLLLHEIKRPINALSAAIQASQGQTRPNDAKTMLSLVNEATAYLEGIGDYDELSSLFENPNTVMQPIATIASDLRSKWRIDVEVADNIAAHAVHADQLLMDIALGNLVENAQKFGCSHKGIRLRIDADATHFLFDVEDDGAGIPQNEWSKVWGKFYRIGAASANAVTGCGLGLHAVKRIVEVHGGYARVLSQSPSRIRVTFPKTSQVSPTQKIQLST